MVLAVAAIAAVSGDLMFPRRDTGGTPSQVILQQSTAEAEGRARQDPPEEMIDRSLFSPEPSITGALPLVRSAAAKTSRENSGQGSGTTAVPRTVASLPKEAPAAEPPETSPPPATAQQAVPAQPGAAAPVSPETAMLSGRTFLDPAIPADSQLGETAALPDPPVAEDAQPEPEAQPAPTRTASARSGRGKRPSGPPPNCGSKHAYWKAAAGSSAWYCR